ncbi:MAG: hypothetical protein E7253_02360 [Lachnospiraceae bacterium]|nr:hypothetical protein [Lachnospiraceae bacterium]
MTAIIKKNYKKIGLFTAAILLALTLVFSDEIIAIVLPSAADLEVVSCELSSDEYVYTGEAMEPEVLKITFKNSKGKEILRTGEEITVAAYHNNMDLGKGDVEVKVKGYMDTSILEDVFRIIPAKTEELMVAQVTETGVGLNWKEAAGVSGYEIFRKEKDATEFTLLNKVTDGMTTSYEDTEITYNKVYEYQVRAFFSMDEIFYGEVSDIVTAYTPLTTPVATGASAQDYNKILVQWEAVEGAVGYQVYRSDAADGEFSMITEITDGTKLSYEDTDRECGKTYYYYIKACQQVEQETISGKASNTVSAKTVPSTVKITGKTTNTNTQVKLTWKKSSGAQGYEVYKKEGSSDYKLVKKIEKADTLTWEESGLSKDKEYTYRIRPYCTVNDAVITGEYSNTYVKKIYVEPVAPSTNNSGSSSNSASSSSGNSSNGSASSGNSSSSGSASGSISGVTQYTYVPYVYGGQTTSGWDCSGFTKWVMKNYYGITISRTAASQATGGRSVSKSDRSSWQAGDLIFFSNGSKVSHVGLYLGNGQMMHALNAKYGTVIQSVDYYENWDPGNYLHSVRRYH